MQGPVRIAWQEDALGEFRGRAEVNRGMGHCFCIMANRRTTPKELPDAVRETLDELVKTAGTQTEAVRERVRGALEDLGERRPATHEDLSALRKELNAIKRRLDAIEERLPSKKSAPSSSARKTSGSTKPKQQTRKTKLAAARTAAKRAR